MVFQSNFPERNRLMAAISDATVIVEASDTSAAYIKLRSACASVAGSSLQSLWQKILRCAGQKILCSIQQHKS